MKNILKLTTLLLISGLTACGTTNSSSGTGTSGASSDIPPVVEPDYTIDREAASNLLATLTGRKVTGTLPSFNAFNISNYFSSTYEGSGNEQKEVYAIDIEAQQFYFELNAESHEGSESSSSVTKEWIYVDEEITHDLLDDGTLKTRYDYTQDAGVWEDVLDNMLSYPDNINTPIIPFCDPLYLLYLISMQGSENSPFYNYQITSEVYESKGNGNLSIQLTLNIVESIVVEDVVLYADFDNYRNTYYEFSYDSPEAGKLIQIIESDYTEARITLPDINDFVLDGVDQSESN
ncbi:MAG: hypothetical protein LBM03_00310 [Erysipelotrichaceae bacterium]|jgi:hypothetical protein|nr:hypothetical protein [Erysipelotrichaceae bacterium]